MADIDGDGDNDTLFVTYSESTGEQSVFSALDNELPGPPVSPAFDAPIHLDAAPFELPAYILHRDIHSVEAADLDGDGDVDLLVGAYFYYNESSGSRIIHFENTGSATAPNFATPQINPFGLTLPNKDWGWSFNQYGGGLGIATGDLDGNGDLDMLLGPYTYHRYGPYYDYASEFFYFENEPIEVEVEEPAASARMILYSLTCGVAEQAVAPPPLGPSRAANAVFTPPLAAPAP